MSWNWRVARAPCVVGLLAIVVSSARAQAGADSARVRAGTKTGTSRAGSAAPTRGDNTLLTGHVVRPDGTPISHVSVGLFGTTDTTVTRDDGGFVLHPSRPGVYMIGARGVGLREKRFATTLTAGTPRDVTVTMVPFVPMMPRVVTTAEERAAYASVGFDQRRHVGVGQFLSYDQILRKHAVSFTQLLQGMRGIELTQGPLQSHASGTGVSGTGGVGSCVSYVVDGTPQEPLTQRVQGTQQMETESPDNLIDVAQVGAVEVYTSAERPPGYAGMEQLQQPPAPESKSEDGSTPLPGSSESRLMSAGSQNNQSYVPSQPCSLVMVWTRARLGLPDPSTITTPVVSSPKTAPHDMTEGLPPFNRDAACTAQAPTDTLDLLVYATVQGTQPSSLSDAAWSTYKDQILGGLVRWADLPSEVLLPSFSLPAERGAARGVPAINPRGQYEVAPTLSTVLALTLDTAGALIDVHVGASSLSGAADTSAIAMVEQAAAAHAFPHLPQSSSDSIPLYLVVESSEPVAGSQAAVLGQLQVPVWRLTRPAHLRSGLPKSERKHGGNASDSLTVTMVVDTAGSVARGTARFEVTDRTTNAPQPAAEARVLQALPTLKFEPASIGSCRVSTVVTESFVPAELGG